MESITDTDISLQINLSPTDFPLCEQLLEIQITYFYKDVKEVVLTVETKKSKGKKFGNNFEENQTNLEKLLQKLTLKYTKVRTVRVDYSPEVKQEVAKRFFRNTTSIPDKDYRGGPFYSYFFGLHHCQSRYIIHMDSDMFLGGNTSDWLSGALKLLQLKEVAFVNPLPGPPTSDFNIKQLYHSRQNRYTYYFKSVTTRFFLTDIEKLSTKPLSIRLIKPSLRRILKGLMQRNFWELPEKLFSDLVNENNWYRVCYWGENKNEGCYTLHPLTKTDSFISNIPALLERIRKNEFTERQRGWYNIHQDALSLTKE